MISSLVSAYVIVPQLVVASLSPSVGRWAQVWGRRPFILAAFAALATLAASKLKVAEFAARKVKQSIVGTGGADKTQVAFMVRRLLPKAGEVSADAADALAVAICGAHHRPLASQRLKA